MHLKKINVILLQNLAVITLAYDTKEDVMEWMINTQLGRRNLPPAQRLAVMDKFKKKIQEQAKENMSIGGSSDKKVSPNGETLIKKQTHTDKEIAKMAGVGTGTVARFSKIMNSNNEDIKQRVLPKKHQLVLVTKNLCKFNRYKIKYYSLTIDMAKKLSMVKNRIIYV